MKEQQINWCQNINQKKSIMSVNDMCKELHKNRLKLVQVQADEIERLRVNKVHLDRYRAYVETLYEHYIINGLPKTYLCS
jgi:predicted glycosyltransferase involved in capsule biosynthesis